MDYKAKYRSAGFRNKFWEKGQVAKNVTSKELKLGEIKHFKPLIKEKSKKADIAKDPEYLSLIGLRNTYVNKFTKDVPGEHYNDPEWLTNEIEKPEVDISDQSDNVEEYVDMDILELRSEYLLKTGKEVPNNMKNKVDWIKNKIEEAINGN